VFFYEMLRDTGSPTEPLANEVVPPPQRGRAMAICQVVRTGAGLFFFSFMIGRWDDTYHLGSWTMTGEMLIYWSGAALALVMIAFYWFAVQEVKPAEFRPADGSEFSVTAARRFLKDVFGSRQNRFLFAIGLAQMIFWIGLGSLGPLLITEQFGYSKQVMGTIAAVGTLFTMILVLPLAGWLADKVNRKQVFVLGAATMTLMHLLFYVYCRYMAPGAIPPVGVLIGFGLVNSAVSNIATMASVAMMFDYVPTSKLGTISAGLGITRGVASVLVNNGVGLWVTGYSYLTMPKGKYDYLSGYQYLFLLGLAATAMSIWFARADARGELSKDGLTEQQARE
jgi:MFS family permease